MRPAHPDSGVLPIDVSIVTEPNAQRRVGVVALCHRGVVALGRSSIWKFFNITAIPPGKRAYPFHNHQINEEMFFILEGAGSIRMGSETYAISKGDLIACPPGGKGTAHQIINTGSVELKFLAVSTEISPDLCDYPDTGKFALMAEMAPEDGKPRTLTFVGREGQGGVDYWEGE